jgi:hypothetical protein
MRRTGNAIFHFILGIAILVTFATTVMAQECPNKFKLRGGKIDNPWKKTTSSAWAKMLPIGWVDNGFHFYSRIRSRGPGDGINTPSDLESEIMKKTADQPEGRPNRREILLPIQNSKGQKLRVIYDYTGKKTAKCQLVTLSY